MLAMLVESALVIVVNALVVYDVRTNGRRAMSAPRTPHHNVGDAR